MAEVKLTKNELRDQQTLLSKLQKYLPTLQLKKAMLQSEVQETRLKLEQVEAELKILRDEVESFCALLSTQSSIEPLAALKVKNVHKRYENVAGVEVPYYEGVDFVDFHYNLFETPPWIDPAIEMLKKLTDRKLHIEVINEQKEALEKELREVSIRVNLFEKILIPRAVQNIKRIKVFLGDQELASVARAKVAKVKIEQNRAKKIEAEEVSTEEQAL